MERIPHGRYTPELRVEAVKLITEGGLSAAEAARRLSIPKSTLEHWARASAKGKLGEIGKSQRPLTEVELELAKVKRELAITKMERDLLKNHPANALSPVRAETSPLCVILPGTSRGERPSAYW